MRGCVPTVSTFHYGDVQLWALEERCQIARDRGGRLSIEITDNRHRRLLCACHHRPRNSSTTEQRDELPPPHSITSSARVRSDSGMVSPSALAVVRLITSSNLVGCSTGKSPGFAPRKILST